MFGLPTTHSTITPQTFFKELTDSEREALRERMIADSIDISEVALIEIKRNNVVYTLYRNNSANRRYVDEETGGVAVRTVRHKIK